MNDLCIAAPSSPPRHDSTVCSCTDYWSLNYLLFSGLFICLFQTYSWPVSQTALRSFISIVNTHKHTQECNKLNGTKG